MSMIPEIKVKLLEALRSGKYTQTKRGLLQWQPGKKKASQYCCLGVLMCVQGKRPLRARCSVNSSVVPSEFNAGLSVQEQVKLAGINDGTDSTFASIADYIEQNL